MPTPRKSLYILPSLFTVASIFCGILAIILTLKAGTSEQVFRAALLIGLAMIFDGFDGRVARMTHTQSEFGVQLDSLADVISFGVAPAIILYQFALESLGVLGVFAAVIYTAAGAIRLARFNVQAAEDNGASAHFVGLPIPAAAGVIATFILVTASFGYVQAPAFIALPAAGLAVLMAGLMVSNVRYKTFKKIRVTPHEKVIVTAAVAFFALIAVKWSTAFALAAVLIFYISLGLFGAIYGMPKRVRAHRALRALRADGSYEEEFVDED